jgi:hypothetical protein
MSKFPINDNNDTVSSVLRGPPTVLPEQFPAPSFVSPSLLIGRFSSLPSLSSHNGPVQEYKHKPGCTYGPYLGSMFQASDNVGCLALSYVLQGCGGSMLIQRAFDTPFLNEALLAIGRGRFSPFCSPE